MQETTPIVGTAERPALIEKYNDEQVRQLVTALEEPFDAREIKWRVTNTTADRRRGQVIAYADPRAYTDRLNALFTVCGWTREYTIQVIQNFERKERGNGDGIISGKIVVTCKLTISGLGSHAGLGEEWADNENAEHRRKHRLSSALVPALDWGGICTIWAAIGLIWTRGGSRFPSRSCRTGHSRSGMQRRTRAAMRITM